MSPRRRAALAVLVACASAAGAAALWLARGRPPAYDMPAVLAAHAAAQQTWDIPWDLHERKVEALKAELATERRPGFRVPLQQEIAQQYVNAGAPEPAIAVLEGVLREYGSRLAVPDRLLLEADLAFAYYRIGEQANCNDGVEATACILPLTPQAAHRQRLGATEAARRYRALLEGGGGTPDQVMSWRWMLNIAAMQMGDDAPPLPPAWRIDRAVFASAHDVHAFVDVAASRGVVEQGRAGGTVLEDFDNDGQLDLLLSHMGMKEPLAYFHNDGNGHFTRATDVAGLQGLTGGLNMVQADYDNDGCIDVYIPRGAWYHDKGRLPASLLHNDCHGRFTDVSAQAGVLNELPSQVAVWADFDGDGWLDLFVGNEIVQDAARWPQRPPNFRLYMNQRNGRFVDAGPGSGIELAGMVKGAAVDDYDNDGRPDLYVSVMGGPNHLLRNLGGSPPRFEDVTARAGVAEPAMSFVTWFFDYDNDGCPDLFVGGYSASVAQVVREMLGDRSGPRGERPRLYHNDCRGGFTDATQAMQLDAPLLAMGANFGDLDNDGWLDFYLGTGAAPLHNIVPNQMFRNAQGRRFENVTTSGGFGHLQKGHGVAFGDIDGRGLQDVVINTGGAMGGDRSRTLIFRNPGHGHHWIKLDLVGSRSNRMAVGARITLQVTEPGEPARRIVRTVGSGGSFGASPLRPHIGIGRASRVDRIEVRWPGSGETQRWEGPIAADTRQVLRQAGPSLQP